nr:hypothetical protein [Pseudomonas hunanensis]
MPGFDNAALLQAVHVHPLKDHLLAAWLPVAECADMAAAHGDAADHQIALAHHCITADIKSLERGMKVLYAALETFAVVFPAGVGWVIDPVVAEQLFIGGDIGAP